MTGSSEKATGGRLRAAFEAEGQRAAACGRHPHPQAPTHKPPGAYALHYFLPCSLRRPLPAPGVPRALNHVGPESESKKGVVVVVDAGTYDTAVEQAVVPLRPLHVARRRARGPRRIRRRGPAPQPVLRLLIARGRPLKAAPCPACYAHGEPRADAGVVVPRERGAAALVGRLGP